MKGNDNSSMGNFAAAVVTLLAAGLFAAEKPPSEIIAPASPSRASTAPKAAPQTPSDLKNLTPRTRPARPALPTTNRRVLDALQKGKKDEDAEEIPNRPLKDLVGEPWLGPSGQRLVAVVEDQYLTKPELDARVALLLKASGGGTTGNARDLEEEKITLAQKIMDDWVMLTTLSLAARKQGFTVSDAEVDQQLEKLATEESTNLQKVNSRISAIGIPQDQLRDEVRKGLEIEKLILATVRGYDKSVFKQIYETEPTAFLVPPQAHVFHVFKAMDSSMTTKQRQKILDELEALRKELKKRNPDYDALTKKSDKDSMLSIGDMGWVSAGMEIDPKMDRLYNKIFGLEPGQTSDVFTAGLGAHVVRVLERKDGSKFTLKDAMPQIENYLFEKTRRATFEAIKPKYKIHMNSGGLSRWREARPGEKPGLNTAAKIPPSRPPAALPAPALDAVKPQSKTPEGNVPEIDLNVLAPSKPSPSKAK
ncbi:peptidylprolyl isomerase [Candidatus Sumerlaeota bacterium]|nr:peptidylprolyl isomerase [Candidatus Sumerlaeota bacterium]